MILGAKMWKTDQIEQEISKTESQHDGGAPDPGVCELRFIGFPPKGLIFTPMLQNLNLI